MKVLPCFTCRNQPVVDIFRGPGTLVDKTTAVRPLNVEKVAHRDSRQTFKRGDLKAVPLHELDGLVLFDTAHFMPKRIPGEGFHLLQRVGFPIFALLRLTVLNASRARVLEMHTQLASLGLSTRVTFGEKRAGLNRSSQDETVARMDRVEMRVARRVVIPIV